jgi:hypothetical protein
MNRHRTPNQLHYWDGTTTTTKENPRLYNIILLFVVSVRAILGHTLGTEHGAGTGGGRENLIRHDFFFDQPLRACSNNNTPWPGPRTSLQRGILLEWLLF